MASRIDGVDVKPVRVAPSNAVHKKSERTAGEAGHGATSEKDVHITGTARGLAALATSVKELPEIDASRVEAVRQRLQDDSYKIDPQRVADRLLHLERQLGTNLLK